METIDATLLKTRLGEMLERATVSTLAVRRHGQVVAYLVPAREFKRPRRAERKADIETYTRQDEERLLKLCASRDFRLSRWRRAGDNRLLAGLAAMLASVDMFDRPRLFALAEQLHPGMSTMQGYSEWLETSPIKPVRFLPMLRARLQQ